MKMCKFCKKKFKSRYSKQIFCSVQCANRQNLNNKNKDVVLPEKYSSELAEFFGIMLGDGTITEYFVKIFLNLKLEQEYAKFVQKLAQKLFLNASATIQQRPSHGTVEVQISSKDVTQYLKSIGFQKNGKIPSWITSKKTYMIAATRGLFDTEGSVGIKYFKGKKGNYFYKQLTVTNTGKDILEFLRNALGAMRYKPTQSSKYNIYISNRKDIDRYKKEVGSSNTKLTEKLNVTRIKEFQYKG